MPRFRRATPRNTKVYGERGRQVMEHIEAANLYFRLQHELRLATDEDRKKGLAWAIRELEAEFPNLKEQN